VLTLWQKLDLPALTVQAPRHGDAPGISAEAGPVRNDADGDSRLEPPATLLSSHRSTGSDIFE